ncbi:hypothetical protein DAEQUDRAFT_407510 [Daedalea quercina L-15889]|uniref:F-box domain-containing protein n=1 Tax=Daedalea quercina L-15889 TaxID=1314783 RepID=A0A165NNT9_9APHY|nr:hypothetical protein DAEQUDRAFT_407510 [Daedalea quercina L-15889]
MRKLSLRFYLHSRTQDISVWSGLLPTNLMASTVRILRIWLVYPPLGQLYRATLMELIQPLLHLHDLEQFNLYAEIWSDEDALVISQSWPAFLLKFSSSGQEASPTWRTMSHFAEHCPNLEQLVIPAIVDRRIDHTDLPVNRPHYRLRLLLLGYADVDCVRCFARYLIQLFPNLRTNGRPERHVRFPYHKECNWQFRQALQQASAKAAETGQASRDADGWE